jgi:cytochrome c oxidase cbb3-type subunit III
MRRPLVALVAALAMVGAFTGGLAWLLSDPRPPAGASRGERLYYAYCAECHGVDGRGSWRAALFLLRPGDLTDPRRMRAHSDKYLFDVIKHGGAPIGRPGMPAFGVQLSDADIEEVVRYVRMLSGGRPTGRAPGPLTSASRSTPP